MFTGQIFKLDFLENVDPDGKILFHVFDLVSHVHKSPIDYLFLFYLRVKQIHAYLTSFQTRFSRERSLRRNFITLHFPLIWSHITYLIYTTNLGPRCRILERK